MVILSSQFILTPLNRMRGRRFPMRSRDARSGAFAAVHLSSSRLGRLSEAVSVQRRGGGRRLRALSEPELFWATGRGQELIEGPLEDLRPLELILIEPRTKEANDLVCYRGAMGEARGAASVRHPNVASVFHLGRTGGSYFYAMEFVEGETLEKLIKRSGRLEVKVALEIASQVAAGLAAVHEQHLVHRDIKPTNIVVSLKEERSTTAKIIELGLAKTLDESASEAGISSPGAFAGTPEFASPEQFAGFGVDIRSDLYSLGVTLWVMVTGQTPFRGPSAEVMYQHQHAPLPLERLSD
jgi:serine/threonine protein kinase